MDFDSINYFGFSAPVLNVPLRNYETLRIQPWHCFNRTYVVDSYDSDREAEDSLRHMRRTDAGFGLLQIQRRHLFYVGRSTCQTGAGVVSRWRVCLGFIWLVGEAP